MLKFLPRRCASRRRISAATPRRSEIPTSARALLVGRAAAARSMIHRHADGFDQALHQRGQVAVHVVEVGQVEKRGAFDQLDPVPQSVRRRIAQQARVTVLVTFEAQRRCPCGSRANRRRASHPPPQPRAAINLGISAGSSCRRACGDPRATRGLDAGVDRRFRPVVQMPRTQFRNLPLPRRTASDPSRTRNHPHKRFRKSTLLRSGGRATLWNDIASLLLNGTRRSAISVLRAPPIKRTPARGAGRRRERTASCRVHADFAELQRLRNAPCGVAYAGAVWAFGCGHRTAQPRRRPARLGHALVFGRRNDRISVLDRGSAGARMDTVVSAKAKLRQMHPSRARFSVNPDARSSASSRWCCSLIDRFVCMAMPARSQFRGTNPRRSCRWQT